MVKSRQEQLIIDELEKVASAHNVDIVDVEITGATKAPCVRVRLEGADGTSLSLDEVCEHTAWVGDMIEARMPSGFTPEGLDVARRVWRGRLTAVTEDAFVLAPATVSGSGEVTPENLPEVRIPWEATRRVARLYVFQQPARPGKGGSGRQRKRGDEMRGGRERKRAPMPNEALDGLDMDVEEQ